MNQTQNSVNLLDIVHTLVKHRWFILKTVFWITLISLGLSLIWPKTYKSTMRFFPPSRDQGGFAGLVGNIFQPMITSSELSTETILLILRSRTLMENVIKRFDLAEVYGIEIPEHLLQELEGNIEISEVREGGFAFNPLIAVEFSFVDEDPERAEQVTTYYVSQLDSILRALNQERARRTFETVEARYLQNVADMEKAEQELKVFQEQYGIFEIQAQTVAIIEQLATLKAQIIENEIQQDFLRQTVSADNSQLLKLQNEKTALEKKYREMMSISEASAKDVRVFQPIERLPELIIQYTRLYRELTVQNKIYEFLFPNYEQLRMKANTQEKGIQVLDPAQLPTYKYKPKRAFIVLGGFIFALFLAFTWVYIREFTESQREANTATYHKLQDIKQALRNDFRRKKK